MFTGPYTNWGGYSSFFPPGGYYTRLDIYLDVPWAAANLDKRFDWSSADQHAERELTAATSSSTSGPSRPGS